MGVPKKKNARAYIKGLIVRKKTFKLLNICNIIKCIYCKKKKKENFLMNDYKSKTIFNNHKICINCIKRIEKKKKNKKKKNDEK